MSKLEPILSTEYWAHRLKVAREDIGDLYRAVFHCPRERWRDIEKKHREILAQHIGPADSILDCGCGWGRLLAMLPEGWDGPYCGVDLSPDFIMLARHYHPQRYFECGDLRYLTGLLLPQVKMTEWAILVSIRPMVQRNLGSETWDEMEREIRKVASKLLYLEYDPDDEGSVE